jgi:hypothetical protein
MSLRSKKKLAKKEFQLYVRIRDSHDGYCRCCTCNKIYHYKEMDGGHFIPATYLPTCFEPTNCHAQCVRCNNWLEGNRDEYFVFMERKYGRAEIDRLMALKNINMKYTEFDYLNMIKKYRNEQAFMLSCGAKNVDNCV